MNDEDTLREIIRLATEGRSATYLRATYDACDRIRSLATELLARMPEPPRARTEAGPYLPLVGDFGLAACPHCNSLNEWADGPDGVDGETLRCNVCLSVYEYGVILALSERRTIVAAAIDPLLIHPVDERDDIVARNLGYGDAR